MYMFNQPSKVALNVKDFGASSLATAAQNNTAIASALAALPTAGGAIIFTESLFISQPMIVDNDSVALIGFGQRTSAPTIQIDPSSDPTYALIVGNTRNANSCLISGLSFVGRNNTTSTGKGILFRSNGGKMFQVKVALFGGNGIEVAAFTGTVFEIFLEDIEITTNGMNAVSSGDGLLISGNVSDCEYHRVIASGDVPKSTCTNGIHVTNSGQQKFIDCHTYFCKNDGFKVDTGVGCQVIGGEFENNTVNGIESGSPGGIFSGTSCFGNANVDLASYTAATIIGNKLSSTVFDNIYVNAAAGGVIADNTCSGASTAILLDTGASGYNVHDNNCSATTTSVIATKSTNSDIHDNTILGGGGIVEQTGAQGNNIHDNTLIGGGTITQIGTTTKIRNNPGFNPRGHAVVQPAIAASTVAVTNTTGCDCTVHIAGGTVTVIAIGGTATGATSGAFRVPVGQTIAITYSVAPTWQWFGD